MEIVSSAEDREKIEKALEDFAKRQLPLVPITKVRGNCSGQSAFWIYRIRHYVGGFRVSNLSNRFRVDTGACVVPACQMERPEVT